MAHSTNESIKLSLWQKIISAGLAGCTADLVTFPLDTVKVWLQVRGEKPLCQKSLSTKLEESNSTHLRLARNSLLKVNRNKQKCPRRSIGGHAVMNEHLKDLNKTDIIKHKSLTTSTTQSVLFKTDRRLHQVAENTVVKIDCERNRTKVLNETALRLQSSAQRRNLGLVGTIIQGVRNNGFFSLYGGISAGLQRQAAFCAVRIGLYDSVKASYHKIFPGSPGGKQVSQRMLAGTTTAFVAVALFQPAEVVKIRMQAQTTKAVSDRIYSSSIQAYRSIFKVGYREAWKGIETNAARLAVVNVCELVTYDIVKELLLDYNLLKDNPTCHFTSAFLSGFVTTVVASPIDVVKTRYMNSETGFYRGPLDCAKSMMSKEGLRSFYKGFVPAYLRLGSWNIVMFVSYEQYKSLFQRHTQGHNIHGFRGNRTPDMSIDSPRTIPLHHSDDYKEVP